MRFKLKIDADPEAYVDAEDAEEIYEPESTQEIVQYSADSESDEDEAPMVSAQEALKCCLFLRTYFVHCDGDGLSEHLSHLASMANAARKNGRSRARQFYVTSSTIVPITNALSTHDNAAIRAYSNDRCTIETNGDRGSLIDQEAVDRTRAHSSTYDRLYFEQQYENWRAVTKVFHMLRATGEKNKSREAEQQRAHGSIDCPTNAVAPSRHAVFSPEDMRSLSEADALAVALQWATRLTAHAGDFLQLRTIRNVLLPVLDVAVTTHWDDRESFDVDKQAFAALRETLGVWCALSCCRGFGGYENPRFWDQVVRRFVKNYGGIEELGRLDFHDEEATPSRVTLKITVQGKVSIDDSDKQRVCDWMRSVCREFFQLGGSGNVNESLSAEYHSVLQHLEPFIDERRLAREAIEVQLAFETWKEELQEYADPDIMEAYTVLVNEIASSYTEECSAIALVVAPVFRIQGIGFDTLEISTKAEFEVFTCLLARNPFPISHMCPSIHSDIDTTTTFSEFVTTALQTKELSETRSKTGQLASPGKVQALTFLQKSADLHPLVCFFSALPYTRSLECLRFRNTRVDWELTKYEASWLVYACFHPRSKTSSWNDLWMDLSGVADDGRAVLKDIVKHPARAVSVTRLAVVSGVVDTSDVRSNDRLQIATVNTLAPICVQANTQSNVLVTLREDTELEMCDLHRQDWRCVLVPGYGFGWVQQHDVAGTREWILEEPVSSSLKVFEMPSAFGVQDGLLVLSTIGGAIETLTLSKKCASGEVLDELMLRCPNLKSLSLEPQEQQIFPASRIESSVPDLLTTLTIRASSEAVKCVKMLHVTDMTPHAFAPAKVTALEAILQANPSLEQLLLTADDRSSSWDMRTHGAELEKHNGEILHRSQLLKQRWAFLSVMNRHRPSALGQLDSAVIAMVFEFATQPVRRLVHLSPLVIDDEW